MLDDPPADLVRLAVGCEAAEDLGIGVLEIRADAAAGPGLFELAQSRAPLRAGLCPFTLAREIRGRGSFQ